MKNSVITIIFIMMCMLLMNSKVSANDDELFADHGWNWYQEEVYASDEETPPQQSTDPIERNKAFRLTMERALIEAYEKPTVENVKKYYEMHRQAVTRADNFQKTWQEMLLQHPEEDYSLVHPADSLGRRIEIDKVNKLENDAIAFFAKSSGLFFFYRSTCPYCRAFAPILKRFSEHYSVSVIAITTDGVPLKEFPESYKDKGQAALFKVKVEPALFIVNPYTKKAIPFGFGLMSESDIKHRFLELAQKMKADKT